MSDADGRGWRDISTAPKDGSPILGYDPEGVEIPSHNYWWRALHPQRLHVLPMRWKTPDHETHDSNDTWVSCFYDVDFGVWDDPSTDFCACEMEPTHWMPLPEPPGGPPAEAAGEG